MRKLFGLFIAAAALAFPAICPAATATFTPQTGYWWNASAPGTGYVIEVQGNTLLFAAFTFDSSGNATWITSTGPMSTATQYSGQLGTLTIYLGANMATVTGTQ